MAFLGELKEKMPEYYPEGDISKKKVRGKRGFAGWQSKTDAIAEAKALYCKASFCNTDMPSADPNGLLTRPLDAVLLKQRTTPTAILTPWSMVRDSNGRKIVFGDMGVRSKLAKPNWSWGVGQFEIRPRVGLKLGRSLGAA